MSFDVQRDSRHGDANDLFRRGRSDRSTDKRFTRANKNSFVTMDVSRSADTRLANNHVESTIDQRNDIFLFFFLVNDRSAFRASLPPVTIAPRYFCQVRTYLGIRVRSAVSPPLPTFHHRFGDPANDRPTISDTCVVSE